MSEKDYGITLMDENCLSASCFSSFCGVCLSRSVVSLMPQRKEADAMAVDGGQVYTAGKCGLIPAMVEQYDEGISTETSQTILCFILPLQHV